MTKARSLIIGLIGMSILLMVGLGCGAGKASPLSEGPKGILRGSLNIGPLCPVEPCEEPIGDLYVSRKLAMFAGDLGPVMVPLRSDGTFETTLPARHYSVELTQCEFLGCQGSLPVSIDIRDGQTATLIIDIDTGIRAPTSNDTMTRERFIRLLTPEDLHRLLNASVHLDQEVIDYREMAERANSAQVEKIDSWYGLTFGASDSGPGMTFTVMDFDSDASAQDHYETVTSEDSALKEMPLPIGDSSVESEVNAVGIGSMLVFTGGDKVISMHTTRSEDQETLLSLEELKRLAELVSDRL